MSPGSAVDVSGFWFLVKMVGRNSWLWAGIYRDIVWCIRRDFTSRENFHSFSVRYKEYYGAYKGFVETANVQSLN